MQPERQVLFCIYNSMPSCAPSSFCKMQCSTQLYCAAGAQGGSRCRQHQKAPDTRSFPFSRVAPRATALGDSSRTQVCARRLRLPDHTAFQRATTRQNKSTRHKVGCFCFGGSGWIRTTEGIASRFTVCPLWPLGNAPIFKMISAAVPPPNITGAGERSRTINLLITNQLLCH